MLKKRFIPFTTTFTLLAVCNGLVPALAAEYTVTKFTDSNDGSCDNADCSLREAINAANASAEEDTIILGAGTYTLSIAGAGEDQGATGDLDLRSGITLAGAGSNATIIDAGGIDRVMHILSPNGLDSINVSISGITFQGGMVSNDNGAGLRNDALANTTLNDVIFTNNSTSVGSGGGLYNLGTMDITAGTFSNNTANVDQVVNGGPASSGKIGGGGIFNDDGGELTLRGAIITANTAANAADNFAAGGGILNAGTLFLLENSLVGGDVATAGNQAPSGGGIANLGGFLTVSRARIANNVANSIPSGACTANPEDACDNGAAGGGIMNQNAGQNDGRAVITNSIITANTSNALGGGIANSGSPLTLTNSAVHGNTAQFVGGGISNVGNDPVEITNVTIAENSASTSGGGLFTTGRINMTSTTVFNNQSASGAQIFIRTSGNAGPLALDPELNLGTSIIAHLDPDSAAANNCAGDTQFIATRNFNVDSGSSCISAASADFGDLIDTDPLLDPNGIQDNGGATPTVALLDGSPAINIGASSCPARDQRFFSRPDNQCDAGAFEFNGLPGDQDLADLKIIMTDNPDPAQLELQLTYTLTVTNVGPSKALGVTVVDTLPEQVAIDPANAFRFFTGSGTCTFTNPEVTCDLGDLNAFESVQFSITVQPQQRDLTLTNTATVSSSVEGADFFLLNNTATEETRVLAFESNVPGFCPPVCDSGGGGGGTTHPVQWLALILTLPLFRHRSRQSPHGSIRK